MLSLTAPRPLVKAPLPDPGDPQFRRADAHHLRRPPRDDPDLDPRLLHHFDPVPVADVEPLCFHAVSVEEDPPVGEHPVHVDQEQAHPGRFFLGALPSLPTAHPTPAFNRSWMWTIPTSFLGEWSSQPQRLGIENCSIFLRADAARSDDVSRFGSGGVISPRF